MNKQRVLEIRQKLSFLSDDEILDFCNSYSIFEIKDQVVDRLIASSNEIISDIKLGIEYIVENRLAIEGAANTALQTYDDTAKDL